MASQTWTVVRSALFEATFVVLGVVLALAANEWREARMNQQQAETAVIEILAELEANRQVVEQSLQYHSALMDSLQTYVRAGQPPSIRLFPQGFIQPARVYQTAWISATETGALSHMDYNHVLQLSRAYALQEAYTQQVQSTGQIIYEELYRGGSTSILANYRNLSSVISTFQYREQQLAASYTRILEWMRTQP